MSTNTSASNNGSLQLNTVAMAARLNEVLGGYTLSVFIRKEPLSEEMRLGVTINDMEFLDNHIMSKDLGYFAREHVEGDVPIQVIKDITASLYREGGSNIYEIDGFVCKAFLAVIKPGQTIPIAEAKAAFHVFEPKDLDEVKDGIDLCFQQVRIHVEYYTLDTGHSEGVDIVLSEFLDNDQLKEIWNAGQGTGEMA